MFKTCSKCRIEKSLDSFHKNCKAKDGKQHRCKDCAKVFTQRATASWRKESVTEYKKSVKSTKLRLKYGLSLDAIQRLFAEQEGKCAICKRDLQFGSDKRNTPHIDHCHTSGVVRGLLCLQCNTGIGMFGDSTELIDSAKSYLSKFFQRERLSELASEQEDAIVRSNGNETVSD